MFARKLKTAFYLKTVNVRNDVIASLQKFNIKCTAGVGTASQTRDKNVARFNSMKIQMLPEKLHRQVFKQSVAQGEVHTDEVITEKRETCIRNLKKFDLWDKNNEILPDVEFTLPPLKGNNIAEHFEKIATEQSGIYFEALYRLATCVLPDKPKEWSREPGWTKYVTDGEGLTSNIAVDFPDEKELIFDCEVLVPEGVYPIMATAVSTNCWYSWCSERILKDVKPEGLMALIPMECSKSDSCNGKEKIIVGHNVSYDRARIREQFYLNETKTRFMDTMSMHIAISGFTNAQQMLYRSACNKDKSNPIDSTWLKTGSLNGLSDVHWHYCGTSVDKSIRNIFVEGTIEEVRSSFQISIDYCAGDVIATHNVLSKLFPVFCERFPHPVTFAAMLEMGQMYLPINRHWKRFIKMADAAYDDLNNELKSTLTDIANEACCKQHDKKYKSDPWLWDLDWSTKSHKLLKSPRKKWTEIEREEVESTNKIENLSEEEKEFLGKSDEPYKPSVLMQKVLNTASSLPKVRPHLPGYPKWYEELCMKENDIDWEPGPVRLSTLTKVTPKLLRLTWKEYPLHHDRSTGWGYLVPKEDITQETSDIDIINASKLDDELDLDIPLSNTDQEQKPISLPDLSERYLFYRLPHKYGMDKNVGSPLSQPFLQKLEEGVLKSADPIEASRCLEINMSSSYWRATHQRIRSQIYMHLPENFLPDEVTEHPNYMKDEYGAIIPITVVSGTVTRRAVESTWLTASNVREKSIGSELKAMIQSPPGYDFVGADVDSQELWIASLFGDAESGKEHGCTPLSWMTLQGTKSEGTDLHSKTADAIAITRDQAKAFNYARMYGSGQNLARNMLIKFNSTISKQEASAKISKLYSMTKGERKFLLSMEGRYFAKKLRTKINPLASYGGLVSMHEVNMLVAAANTAFGHLKQVNSRELIAGRLWDGGMESEMFNKLEKIAKSSKPCTPVLGARISRTLEPFIVKENNFLPSRMNWAVQSSAVDYMHLMLVCMRWLIRTYSIQSRFSISIHDELRYLSVSEDKYRTALALQISNLLTRSMFAYKLGMEDLPLGVAFFSSVEIDKALRKKHNDDCVTPSNPLGLRKSCGIEHGQSLDIFDILRETNNGQLTSNTT